MISLKGITGREEQNMECNIMIVKIGERRKKSPEVQEVLSKFGCSIKTRLGLHEASESLCSEEGVLVLQLTGDRDEMKKLEKALNEMESIKAKMVMID
jgi:cell division protein FtsI/penicillin-binding protein 2